MLPNKELGASHGINVEVDPDDDTIIHFGWKITRAITQYNGVLSTLICIKQVDEDGDEIYHWNTVMFQRFTVDAGMECSEVIAEENTDIITQMLVMIDTLMSMKNGSTSGVMTAQNTGTTDIVDNNSLITEVTHNV